ncbi:MAG: helix-turn-helix domain-containing protein [Bacteroidaceae bacterium]|nr:helix-turn-helix domain-containing protein [Bacteroidaceae bacterium]
MAQNFEQFSQSDSRLLTIKEAADFLRISRRSLFYLISNGRLQTVKLSPRTTRISLKELQRLTEATFVVPAIILSSFLEKMQTSIYTPSWL